MPLRPLGFFLVVLAVLPLLLVIYHVSMGTTPNVQQPDPRLPGQPRNCLIFFGGIAQYSLEDFGTCLRTRTRESYLADLTAQQHQNSRILGVKFKHLSKAYWWLWVSYVAFIGTSMLFLLGACKTDSATDTGRSCKSDSG
mmetsp:Transcript_61255/g.175713  ORF Transcript_61255/g.175713 Transcript_61255/m.175713 type:complete len:140 (+) Transcript_61255:2-421(+)